MCLVSRVSIQKSVLVESTRSGLEAVGTNTPDNLLPMSLWYFSIALSIGELLFVRTRLPILTCEDRRTKLKFHTSVVVEYK